jgi:two-component system LytT family sensor kinase
VFFLQLILRLEWTNLLWSLGSHESISVPISKVSKNLFRDYAVVALGVCLKIIRDWDRKDRLQSQLQHEKRDAELQFLRAQIHPHFLFNTLNNLYGLALTGSPHTADSIMRLSGLLDFILYECGGERIPLQKEVELIRHYIELERLRFGDRLDLRFHHDEGDTTVQLAPLLLLPFVENAFKHGAGTVNNEVFVRIDLHVTGQKLHFQVENSTAPHNRNHPPNGQNGIGLRNVVKRLELLYPGRHSLRVLDKENVFLVALQLELS